MLATIFGVVATYPLADGFEERRPIVHHFYLLVHNNLAVIFALLFVAFLFGKLLKGLGDPWVLNKLQFILDSYQERAFMKNGQAIPRDHNRITLFKMKRSVIGPSRPWMRRRGRRFFSNHLVPILRSGHTSKKSKVAFHVPDSGDEAEGIAGLAWVSEEVAEMHNLPAIVRGCAKRDIKAYAESTRCAEEMIEHYAKEGKQLPRAIVAIPVEKNGRNWGVIVLDSRYPEGISADAADNYRLTIAIISHLLERL
ncbi:MULTISPECIES: GAF domain-containing protein [unclassified Pseudomonas]|uniref:GAF domain-containing protein n=1 Tax=unclassified Pseudomonas TaxID=196821 RepID=UPI00244A5FB0|nr:MULTISPECIES: GAF domain-containing protein [unclassified Pseudomonas]MDH0894673.1 GAF domain-containing protein [Pseudomonas sp. GD03875]MDH1067277.1 GAF domain-containing protein [Pseudomonas sp. GD03985]